MVCKFCSNSIDATDSIEVCKCGYLAHPKCLAQQQFIHAGTPSESRCVVCDTKYPPWRENIMSRQYPMDDMAMLDVNYKGRFARVIAMNGADGRDAFCKQLKRVFKFEKQPELFMKCTIPGTTKIHEFNGMDVEDITEQVEQLLLRVAMLEIQVQESREDTITKQVEQLLSRVSVLECQVLELLKSRSDKLEILSHFQTVEDVEAFILFWLDTELEVRTRAGSGNPMLKSVMQEFRMLSSDIRTAKCDIKLDADGLMSTGAREWICDIVRSVKPGHSSDLQEAFVKLKDNIIAEQSSQHTQIQQLIQDCRQQGRDSQSQQHALNTVLDVIKSNTQSTQAWVSSMLGQKGSKVKGNVAELTIIDLLKRNFDAQVESVAQSKESTDLVFTAPNKPPIRVEVKQFGADNTVPSKDIKKFQRDLLACNQHGIMVSINSSIATKDNFTFEVLNSASLPGEHCIAFYISNVGIGEHSLERLKPAINMVYLLHNILTTDTESHRNKSISFTQDEVRRLIDIYDFWGRRVDELKDLNKRSLSMLNDLQCEAAMKVLCRKTDYIGVADKFTCDICNIECKSKSGLTQHKNLKHSK